MAHISVRITPGATQVTRMPLGPSSLARALVRAMTAPLVADYTASQEAPTWPHMELTVMTQPACLFRKKGMAALTQL